MGFRIAKSWNIAGLYFERFANDVLKNGGSFDCFRVKESGERYLNREQIKIEIPPLKEININFNFKGEEFATSSNKLYLRMSENNQPLYDSVCIINDDVSTNKRSKKCKLFLFQHTISATHRTISDPGKAINPLINEMTTYRNVKKGEIDIHFFWVIINSQEYFKPSGVEALKRCGCNLFILSLNSLLIQAQQYNY
ncbi:MAG: hypothetical protein LBQ59_03005 [Candidatus Peribacteria bacterium]|nr:hypothetical protein [Candidatus Peribacteria bacterium]